MNSLELRSGPHLQSGRDVARIMWTVVLSLVPVCGFYIYQYGVSALALMLAVTLAGGLTEAFFRRQGVSVGGGSWRDGSAAITGLLLALSLPPGFPLWMGAVAGVAAVALGKVVFGGIGHNLFNPALVGRAFVQAAFPSAIAAYTPSFLPGRWGEFIPSSLAWPFMQPADTAAWLHARQLDALAGATPLARWKFEGVAAAMSDLLTALHTHLAVGPSPLLILLCGAFLAFKRYLDWRIPTAILGSVAILGWGLHAGWPQTYPTPMFMLLSGGLVLGAVYMATDMVTSPVTPWGIWLYGALIGGLTIAIRYHGGLPEGVMYAILIGNACVPLIEKATQPRVFGTAGILSGRRHDG